MSSPTDGASAAARWCASATAPAFGSRGCSAMTDSPNVLGIIIFTTAIGLLPLFVVTMTGFLKIAVVLFLVRNALGTQQTPPNILLYGIALVLTVYVTTPLIGDI